MLYPDWTTLVQLVLFVSVYFIFSKVFFAPYMRLLEARDIAQGKDIHRPGDAHNVDESGAGGSEVDQVANLRERLDEATKKLHAEAAAYRNEHLGVIRTQAKNELDNAADSAAKEVGGAKAKVSEVKAAVRAELDSHKGDLLNSIQQKLVEGA